MKSSFLEMPSGLFFDLGNPTHDAIDMFDIAHNLSSMARFNGGTIGHDIYSVAEHSIWVSEYCYRTTWNPLIALHGLLHDAHEAYTGDFITPIKNLSDVLKAELVAIQAPIQAAILSSAGLSQQIPDIVHRADQQALAVESRHLMPSRGEGYYKRVEIDDAARTIPYPATQPRNDSALNFIRRFNCLKALADAAGIKEPAAPVQS